MSTNFSTNGTFLYPDNNKRKLDFTSDDIVWQDFPLPKKKKKKKKPKKKKEPISGDNNLARKQNLQSNDNFQIYNQPNYTQVNAKPENLASTPQIFNKEYNTKWNQKPQTQDTSNFFYMNCISDKCFSSDIRNRFINFIKAHDQSNDKQATVANDSKNINKNITKNINNNINKNENKNKVKNKSGRINPPLKKFQQRQAEKVSTQELAKKKIEELVEQGLKSIRDNLSNEENQRKEKETRTEQNQREEEKIRTKQNQRKEEEIKTKQNQRKEEEIKTKQNQRKEEEIRTEQNQRKDVNSRNKCFPMRMINENEFHKVDIYESNLKDAVVFHMHYQSEFSFHGEIKITVIAGRIEILGCVVSKSTGGSVDVYSPNFYTPLIVECKHFERMYDKDDVKNEIVPLLKMNDVNKLLDNLTYNGAILLVEQIKSTFGGVIDLYFHKSLFSKDLVDFSSESESLKALQSTFNFKVKCEGVRKSQQWDGIPMDHCLVACGGQNVGKSTLLKYFVNKALTQKKKVLWLDFDPGQPEFTPPGYLSAVVVDKPLLGPNFSHMMDPELMVYFGSANVSYNPSLYLECVNYIIEKCREKEELSQMTWFVNTMGFNRGVGVELMSAIIKLLKPNIVVQIKSSDPKRNYPFYFTPRHVNGKKSVWSFVNENVELSYDLRVVDSFAQKGRKQSQGALTAKQLREILFFSYFSKMVSPPDYSFNAVKPYVRSFSNLYLGIESLISPMEILKAFNGSIVSLSHFEHSTEEIFVPETETDDYFKIVIKPAISPSLGLGLVRGINVEEKTLYVLTHLSDEKLDEVNCLSLGRIDIPYSMFLIQEDVKGQLPYTCVSSIDFIQKVNRLFPLPVKGSDNDK